MHRTAILASLLALGCRVDPLTAPTATDPAFPFGDRRDTLGSAISDVMAYAFTVPESGDQASKLVQADAAARATLAADPAAAEARILQPCKDAPRDNPRLQFTCAELLSAFDTPATVAWLAELATADLSRAEEPSASAASELDVPPDLFRAQRALAALRTRAAASTDLVGPTLVDAAVNADPLLRDEAIDAVFAALPRAVARAELLRRLDPSDHPDVYAHP